jgi:hypothetical protein
MSLFGKLDAEVIKTNPFHIPAGDYSAEVTKAEYRQGNEGQKQIYFQFTITEEGSPSKGQKPNMKFNLPDPEMTQEMLELLPVAEQQKINRSLGKLKKILCGTDGNDSQRGLGVKPDDLNDADWDPNTLVGTKINMGIGNFGSDGVEIRWVNKIDVE